MLALHLLQSALVHINTLLLQQILAEPEWSERMTEEDRRALSPLFWTHVNPYGRFVLDMDSRLDLATGEHEKAEVSTYPASYRLQCANWPQRTARRCSDGTD